jgi:hypothetical protein
MQFSDYYSGAAVCAPARSVLMTGLHTGHTRVRGNFGKGGVIGLAGKAGRVPIKEEDLTVAEVLQDKGYHTGMIGKWGLGEPNTSGEPNQKGFDYFYGFYNQRRAHSYYPEYLWENTQKIILHGNEKEQRINTRTIYLPIRPSTLLTGTIKSPFFSICQFVSLTADMNFPIMVFILTKRTGLKNRKNTLPWSPVWTKL